MDIHNVVRLVEEHADALARRWMEAIRKESGVEAFLKLPQDELLRRVTDVYREIGIFLDQPKVDVIGHYFADAGRMRRRQGVPVKELVRALQLARDVVWDFVMEQGNFNTTMNLYQGLQLHRQITVFFDWAVVHGVEGYCQEG